MDGTARARRIAADHAAMHRYITLIAPPHDHRWYLESAISPGAAVSDMPCAEPCVVMRRDPPDHAEPTQLLIEIRMLWIHEGPLHPRHAEDTGYCYEAVVRAAVGARHDYIADTTERFRHDYLTGLWGQVALNAVTEIQRHKSRLC